MNQHISWVKSTHYDGLNKQLKLLGKIKPKCVLSYIYLPSPWVKHNPNDIFYLL